MKVRGRAENGTLEKLRCRMVEKQVRTICNLMSPAQHENFILRT